MYAYDLHELRFVQEKFYASAADEVQLNPGTPEKVPRNKLWTVLAACYFPSATETRLIVFGKIIASGNGIPLRVPVSIALGAAVHYPLLTEGNQLILHSGEGLYAIRDNFTAGSTMTIGIQYVESDLPTMKYHDTQKLLSMDRRRRGFARGSILGSVAAAIGGHGGEPGGGGEGGEGGSIPV